MEDLFAKFLDLMNVRDEEVSESKAIGTLSEIFKNHEGLLVSNNTDKERGVIIYRGFTTADGKPGTKSVVLSKNATALVRKGLIGISELSGFPVIWNDEKKSMFVGIPSLGWFKQNEIKVRAYVARVVDYADANLNSKLAGV